MLEIEPFIIRTVFIISGSGLLAVEMTGIEIAAVFAHMIEDAIQDQMHIVFMQHRDQHFKVFFSAQHRVNFQVVIGIIAMIAWGLKYRVQIKRGYA